MIHDPKAMGVQVLDTLRAHPDRTAFVWDGGSLTYAGTSDLIARFQHLLLSLELDPESRVALLSANRADAWCAATAALVSGLVPLWLHPAGSTGDHIFLLEDSDARVLIIDPSRFADAGADLVSNVGNEVRVFTLGPAEFGTDILAAATKVGSSTPRHLPGLDDLALFYYTGGTTGRPKACARTHREAAMMPAASLINFEMPPTPNFLAVGPISHAAGHCIIPSLIRGGTVHLLTRFDPAEVLASIQRERINSLLAVPTMIYSLLDEPSISTTDLSSIEWLLYGASPMSPSRLEEALARFGSVFNQLYGLTECAPLTVMHRADHSVDRPDRLRSCGKPAVETSLILVDDEDREVAGGEIGEICGRSPCALKEYWNQPDQTAEAFRDGWFHTGDLARADEQGFLYIVDRKKDMIVSGGFNVYPREIEDVLMRHPEVAIAAVIGTPHARWGEAVSAMVVRRPGASLTEQEVVDLVKASKGAVYAPKVVQFLDELPHTAAGKVDKRRLRADYWATQERAVG